MFNEFNLYTLYLHTYIFRNKKIHIINKENLPLSIFCAQTCNFIDFKSFISEEINENDIKYETTTILEGKVHIDNYDKTMNCFIFWGCIIYDNHIIKNHKGDINYKELISIIKEKTCLIIN